MALGPKLWHKIKQYLVLLIIAALTVAVVIILINIGYGVSWTGFNAYTYISPKVQQYQREKTLWDWLQLLFIPAVIAVGGVLFNRALDQTNRKIASNKQQEDVLQEYLDKMSELLLNKNLHTGQMSAEIIYVASVRTLITLHRLDPSRKKTILQFLSVSGLISILDLKEADLSGANLSNTNLSNINLSNTNLSGAILSETNLSGTNLNRATLSNAILHKAILSKASFVSASLNFSDLSDATLREADLSNADLREANLSGVTLSGAKLIGANLGGANVSDANMSDAVLDNASLIEVSLSDKQLNEIKSRNNIDTTMKVDTSNIDVLREKTPHTGTYGAGLIATIILVPLIAALLSAIIYIALPQLPGSKLMTALGGTILTLMGWLLVSIPYRRLTAVDRANASSYELLLNRLYQLQALITTLQAEPKLETKSVQTISKEEVSNSLNAIYLGLTQKGISWILGTGYVNMWRLMHRVDEALIDIEPIEAVIHDALHDEISLQDATIENKDDLLNKLRRALKILDQGGAVYLNQQVLQDDQTKPPDHQATPSAKQNTVNPKQNDGLFSNTINSATQARSIIREVRFSLHQFRDDRWDMLLRFRTRLMNMILVTGLLLYVLVEFAIIMSIGAEMLKAAIILYFVGAIVGLFSRLYDQAKTDTSIDDFRLAAVRLLAAPLYSGLAAIGGVVIVQRAILTNNNVFDLNLTNILVAAVFGLTPSLFVNALQRQADQYKADLKSTQTSSQAPPGVKRGT